MALQITPQGVKIVRGWPKNDIVNNLSDGQIEMIVRMGIETDCINDELIALSKKALEDGVVTTEEAETIFKWLKKNINQETNVVSKVLFSRIREMFSDGVLDEDERKELLYLLGTLHGETRETSQEGYSTDLPFCQPAPGVIFTGKGFCFTGQFAFGPRKVCEKVVRELGGTIESRINWRVDYLVVGTLCTNAWAHSTHGRKIEEAVFLKSGGQKNIHIISENHWARAAFKI